MGKPRLLRRYRKGELDLRVREEAVVGQRLKKGDQVRLLLAVQNEPYEQRRGQGRPVPGERGTTAAGITITSPRVPIEPSCMQGRGIPLGYV